jgi:hypothetical protein
MSFDASGSLDANLGLLCSCCKVLAIIKIMSKSSFLCFMCVILFGRHLEDEVLMKVQRFVLYLQVPRPRMRLHYFLSLCTKLPRAEGSERKLPLSLTQWLSRSPIGA